MSLLKQKLRFIFIISKWKFTFHYVTIKTLMGGIVYANGKPFTFHYVTIKTKK